jgi:hypothetical protein
MPKRYAREFRWAVCVRLVAGQRVTSLPKFQRPRSISGSGRRGDALAWNDMTHAA